MSDSSDEGEPFQIRNYDDDDSEDERPNKRRKTMANTGMRPRAVGFVPAQQDDGERDEEDAEQEEDPDDERPTMGLGMGMGMGMGIGMNSFRGSFNIGEYNHEAKSKSPSPEISSDAQTPPVSGRGPSAFGTGGKIQKNSFAARMMAKQGYVEGQGLGKSGQGITAPIQTQMLQARAGLGHGNESERPKKSQAKPAGTSRTSTPGASTPKLKAPPKAKYNVTAIESRGLHIPEAMKSIIVDATGAETKTVSSLSGFSTPTSETGPPSEAAKASSRIQMQLKAYADAWDTTKEQETNLELEENQLDAASKLYLTETQRYRDIISSLERVSMDDSGEARTWDHIIKRLQDIQDEFADHIEELDLPEMAAACIEAPFRRELVNWDPFSGSQHLVEPFQNIGALLELEKALNTRHRKRTTVFETLLLQHWYPRLRIALKEWNVYDSEPATALIDAWRPIMPKWLLYKILNEIVLPKLIETVRRFPKAIDTSNGALNQAPSSGKKRMAPGLHSWLVHWWTLISSDELDLERFPELRHLVKSKVDSETWSMWKPLLGSRRPAAAKPPAAPVAPPTAPGASAAVEDISFKDILESWCADNDLTLRSSGTSDSFGRLLYRLQHAEKRSKGVLVYFQDDGVIFDEDGEPYGLDEKLINKALNKQIAS